MKLFKFVIASLVVLTTVKCSTNHIVSINADLQVISATRTLKQINKAPGARLDFTIVTSKAISLDSVYYWEHKHPLTITKTNKDTIWAKSEFPKPNYARELKDDIAEQMVIRPIDTTCILIYSKEDISLKIAIPKIKKLN